MKTEDEAISCGGALINDQYILTAANCFYGIQMPMISVYLGGHLRTEFNLNRRNTLSVEKIIMHEDYNDTQVVHDIALLKLTKPVQFSEKVSPICLPKNGPMEYKTLKAARWGATEHTGAGASELMQVDLFPIPFDECNEHWNSKLNPLYHFCARGENKDVCQGDSGSPLMGRKAGKYFAAGIVSFGKDCGGVTPGVYTNVISYVDWISQKTEDSNYCLN